MGYELKCDELNLLVGVSQDALWSWGQELQEIRRCLGELINSESWSGQTAESMKSYLYEVHVAGLLPLIGNLMEDYLGKLALYDYGYGQLDDDIHKKLNGDAIREAEERYRPDRLEECRDAFGEVLCSISGIAEIGNPSVQDIGNDCGRIHYRLERLMNGISKQEETAVAEWTGPLEELAESVSRAVREAIGRPSSGMTGYHRGDFAALPGIEEACMKARSCAGYRSRNQSLIEAAGQYEMEVGRKLQEEYESQKEEEEKRKRDHGLSGLIGSGLMIVAGVTAVVTSGGAALPVVLGVATVTFGASDMVESGAQYITGADHTYNPLRDSVFGGNQGVYGSIEMLACLTCGFGSGMNSAVKAEQVVTKGYAARWVAGETVSIVASAGVNEIGRSMGLSDTFLSLLDLGTGLGVGKLTKVVSGKKAAVDGGDILLDEEELILNAGRAREDLNIRTNEAIAKRKIYNSEGGSGAGMPSTREELHQDLLDKGYRCNGTSAGGYVTYMHPDGRRVDIRPNGEVINTLKEWLPDHSRKITNRYFYDGTLVPNGGHNTGEFVDPIGDNTFLPPKPSN